MPSTMIHLAIAREYEVKVLPSFYIGNIAPDAVYTREEKDIIHFRNNKDRYKLLYEFKNKLNLEHPFNLGYLLHLYTDYKWDNSALKEFTKTIVDEQWFMPYREEIALAGGYLFHSNHWSEDIYKKMMNCDTTSYIDGYNVDIDNIKEYINRTYRWNQKNNIGPSKFYTPLYITEFINKVIVDFNRWLKE